MGPRLVSLLLLVLLLPAPAPAHSRSVSYSAWELDATGADVTLRIAEYELTRLPFGTRLGPRLAEYLTARLTLRATGEPCAVAAGPSALRAPPGRARIAWRVECGASGPREIESRLLLDVAPSHLHFARVARGEGEGGPVVERVLSNADPSWSVGPPGVPARGSAGPEPGSSLFAYVSLGIEHILSGTDHLVFVIALLLLASRLAEVATIVTGFTIAHSITLALAVLGRLRPEADAVEALIGLSIALVAAENAWLLAGRPAAIPFAVLAVLLALAGLALGGVGALDPFTCGGLALFAACYFGLLERAARPARLRAALAFVFGLVHGFGFAGVLEEISLPTARLATALFGFNAGVELGQLAVVALAWPLLRALASVGRGRAHALLVETATAGVCGLGVFWLVDRAFG